MIDDVGAGAHGLARLKDASGPKLGVALLGVRRDGYDLATSSRELVEVTALVREAAQAQQLERWIIAKRAFERAFVNASLQRDEVLAAEHRGEIGWPIARPATRSGLGVVSHWLDVSWVASTRKPQGTRAQFRFTIARFGALGYRARFERYPPASEASVRTKSFTRISRAFLGLVPLLAALIFAGCNTTDSCKTSAECQKQGKCTADKNGVCVASSDADCKGSELCKAHGKCTAQTSTCTAATDDDCRGSEDCTKGGACSAYQGSCTDASKAMHAECSKTCASDGLCAKQGSECVALSRFHCAGTSDEKPETESPCARLGLCGAEKGKCVATSDADCARSLACKQGSQCAAKEGRCTASEESCKKSSVCANEGKCGVSEGKCAAVSAGDCRSSGRCKLEGACSLKAGACIAASSADCAQASVCTKAKRCQAKDGVCIGSGGGKGGSEKSGPPDKVGSTTISGLGI